MTGAALLDDDQVAAVMQRAADDVVAASTMKWSTPAQVAASQRLIVDVEWLMLVVNQRVPRRLTIRLGRAMWLYGVAAGMFGTSVAWMVLT